MPKSIHTITKDVSVRIYDNEQYVARVYDNKIIVKTPYVKWIGNIGWLAIAKNTIRRKSCISAVLQALNDDCEDDAWELIGAELYDAYLCAA